MGVKKNQSYHVGNFPILFLKKKIFSVKLRFDVNMTSQSRDFWRFLPFLAIFHLLHNYKELMFESHKLDIVFQSSSQMRMI